MFRFVGTLLVGILSASLAVIYQNDIAGMLGRAPVTVRVIAGGWYPVLLLWALSHGFSFAKSLLKDEDYYLSERVRFDTNPEKYSVPDTLPKS